MTTKDESVCCREIRQVSAKMTDAETLESLGGKLNCITYHPGFRSGCLNVWALEIAYLQYRQMYGAVQKPLNE